MRATAQTTSNAHISAQQRRTSARQHMQAIRATPEPRNAAHAMLGGKDAMPADRGVLRYFQRSIRRN